MDKLIEKIEKAIGKDLVESLMGILRHNFENKEDIVQALRVGLILEEMQLEKETIISGIFLNCASCLNALPAR